MNIPGVDFGVIVPVIFGSMRFASKSIKETVRESNTNSNVGSGGNPGGTNTMVQFNDNGTFGGDAGFTYIKGTDLAVLTSAVDGNYEGLRIVNSTAADAGTNETAQIRFGFGTDNDVARIAVGKLSDFTTAALSDSYMAFSVDVSGTSKEYMRIGGTDTSGNWQGGVAINSTDLTKALFYMKQPAANSGFDIGLLIEDSGSPTGNSLLATQTDNIVQVGSTTYTSTINLNVLSAGAVSLLLRGRDSFNTPAFLTWRSVEDGGGETFDGGIGIQDVTSGTRQRKFKWTVSNIASVESEQIFLEFNQSPSQVLTLLSGASYTNQRAYVFNPQTINGVAGGGAETVTNAATVYIADAPSGSNITITNAYALWVDSGNVRFDGNLTVSGTINAGTTTLTGDLDLSTNDIITDTTTGTKIGTGTTQKIGLYNATPVAQGAALTTQLTTITHTAPGTDDFAIQNLTSVAPFGFVTADEGNTVLKVVANIQTRLAEVEARLEAIGLVAAN